jgi:transcriptional regulator with XRE-family HTH domain
MPFTAATFGRKLATLRADFDQDLDDLAAASGIPAERLGLFESGHDEPTGDEVLILADHFRKDFRFFISDDALDPDEGMELLFREHGNELSAKDRIAIAEFAYLSRCQAVLERELGVKPNVRPFDFQPSGTYYKGHGRDCAAALRRHLGLGEKEVLRDIFSVMRQLGIKVFRRRLENSDISGLFMNHPEAGRCILGPVEIHREFMTAAAR